jgi:hypothetical protein
MRRCDIVSGILLILSIIDFALAAPVLLQEKHQASTACVGVVHIPKDVITVLGKRGDEWLEKFVDDYLKNSEMENSVESSDTHASSDSSSSLSAPPGFEPGWRNLVQAPAPNAHLPDEYLKTSKPPILDSSDVHASSGSASSGSTRPGTDHGSTNVVQAPASNLAPSIANPNPLIESSGPSAAAPMQGS